MVDGKLKDLIMQALNRFPAQGGVFQNSENGTLTTSYLRLVDSKVFEGALDQVLDLMQQEFPQVKRSFDYPNQFQPFLTANNYRQIVGLFFDYFEEWINKK